MAEKKEIGNAGKVSRFANLGSLAEQSLTGKTLVPNANVTIVSPNGDNNQVQSPKILENGDQQGETPKGPEAIIQDPSLGDSGSDIVNENTKVLESPEKPKIEPEPKKKEVFEGRRPLTDFLKQNHELVHRPRTTTNVYTYQMEKFDKMVSALPRAERIDKIVLLNNVLDKFFEDYGPDIVKMVKRNQEF